MILQRGSFHIFRLWFLLTFTHAFEEHVGETIYRFDKNGYIGEGALASVYKGQMVEGEKTDIVAFKEANNKRESSICLDYEKDIHRLISDHEQIPTFHHYFPATDERGMIIVMEFLGETMKNLVKKYNRFSTVTTMKIGLQLMDVLEYLHRERKVVHHDIHIGNIAVGHKNDSRIYLFDFNVSEQIGVENRCFKALNMTEPNLTGSPQIDLCRLAHSLYLLADTRSDFVDSTEAITEFTNLARDKLVSGNQIDYDEFRNILKTELEKHRNEPDYDKFDWQKY